MTKGCELTLTDESLLADIRLLGDVILAVNLLPPGPLTESEVDEALGVPHPRSLVNKLFLLAARRHPMLRQAARIPRHNLARIMGRYEAACAAFADFLRLDALSDALGSGASGSGGHEGARESSQQKQRPSRVIQPARRCLHL